MNKEKKIATCPECEGEVTLTDNFEEGEILSCDECGLDLEIISTDPIELNLAPEEDEDWGE